jgi:superfamily II DNA/RNA helicase
MNNNSRKASPSRRPGRSNGSRFASKSGGRGHRTNARRGNSRRGGGRKKAYINPNMFINRDIVESQEVKVESQHAFTDFGFQKRLADSIASRGFTDPTAIQDQSIPVAIQGHDVVGLANTGTGKTAAFLLPLIDKTLKNKSEKTIVLAPTRELALQIEDELNAFTKKQMGIFSVACVGGSPISRQINFLKKRNQFVIGTPGRITDLIKRGVIDMSTFTNFVLDEADRMLDMGFVADMKFILGGMPTERQGLLFSATMSPTIKNLISGFLTDPVEISVVTRTTAESIYQDIVKVEGRNKTDILHDLLGDDALSRVIVFGETKRGVDRLHKDLKVRGHKAESMHGDKTQWQRKKSLNNFKAGHARILIATDVMARGIDVEDVSHVINYETPMTYDDYVHRIGRTGRGSKKGIALTFVD